MVTRYVLCLVNVDLVINLRFFLEKSVCWIILWMFGNEFFWMGEVCLIDLYIFMQQMCLFSVHMWFIFIVICDCWLTWIVCPLHDWLGYYTWYILSVCSNNMSLAKKNYNHIWLARVLHWYILTIVIIPRLIICL